MSGGRRVASRNENFGETEYSGERRSRRRENREYAERNPERSPKVPREPKEPGGPKVDPILIFIIVTIVIVIAGFITLFVMGLKNGKVAEEKPVTNEVSMNVVEEKKLEDTYEGFKVLGNGLKEAAKFTGEFAVGLAKTAKKLIVKIISEFICV